MSRTSQPIHGDGAQGEGRHGAALPAATSSKGRLGLGTGVDLSESLQRLPASPMRRGNALADSGSPLRRSKSSGPSTMSGALPLTAANVTTPYPGSPGPGLTRGQANAATSPSSPTTKRSGSPEFAADVLPVFPWIQSSLAAPGVDAWARDSYGPVKVTIPPTLHSPEVVAMTNAAKAVPMPYTRPDETAESLRAAAAVAAESDPLKRWAKRSQRRRGAKP